MATILARTAARDTSLLALIADDTELSESGRRLRRELLESAGVEVAPEEAEPAPREAAAPAKRQVVPRSVISRQLANPFLAPDLERRPPGGGPSPTAGRLGAARPAVALLRGRGHRCHLLHAAARAVAGTRARRAWS